MSQVISVGEQEIAVTWARGAIRAGEVVVVPTDTVYGIAADPFAPHATAKVFELKGRPRSLPLPVLVSRPRQAWALTGIVPSLANDLAAEFWPGALTMILAEGADMPWDLGQTNGKVALRMPAHDTLIALLEVTGPLAVTSANVSGERTPRTIEEIRARFGEAVTVYLDGGPSARDAGSTIVDLTGEAPVCVREGLISIAEIARVAGVAVARAP